MAAQLFYLPFLPALDMNGFPIAGAKAYFYVTGTNTLAPVYVDDTLTGLLSNPVVADAAGRWPSIYLDNTIVYRLVIKDSSDVTIPGFDVDPYIPGVTMEVTVEMQAILDQMVATAAEAATSAENAAESETNAALSAAAAGYGYHYHPIFGTRYRGYSLRDGVLWDVISPELYWDPFKAGASGDGSTHEDAVKTSAEVRAWLAANTGPRTVAVHASDQSWVRDQLDIAEPNAGNGSAQRSQVSLVSYSLDGSQKLVFFNGMDKVNASSWSAHGSIANAYQVSWTHSVYSTSTSNLRVFQTLNGKLQPLNRVQTEAETSTAGTYWYDNTLSAAGTETIVAHFWGNTNPTTQADGFAEITKREYAFSGRDNCFVQGIAGFATASNNGSLFMYNGGAVGCFLEEGTKHNWVAGATDFRGVVCFNAFSETNYAGAATTPAMATAYTNDPDNATYNLTDCYSICDADHYDNTDGGYSWASAFYSHGSSSAVGRLVITGGGDNCINWGSEALAHTISGYTVQRRGGNNRGLTGANMTVSGCLVLDTKNAISGSGTVFDVEGNVIVSSVGGNTADIETSVPNPRIVRNLVSHPSAQEPRIKLSGADTPIIEENILDLGGVGNGAVQLNASPTGTMRLNKNYYLRPADPPGGSYPNLLVIGASSYANLADVQALGYEADGGATGLDTPADAKFTAGQYPTPTALDVRLNTDSPILVSQTEQIAQADVNVLDEQISTKTTRAACISYVEAYNWYPVRVQVNADTVIEPDPVTVDLDTLPTTEPATAGLLWNNGGSLAVSGVGGGSGTVTSVSMTVPTGFSVAGSPVTTSGTLALTYASGYQGYTITEATKLSGIATGATSNSSDATLLNRANHTGTQTSSTISDFTEAAQDAVGSMVDTTLTYVDGTPLLQRAALTGDVTASAGSNTTTIANSAVTLAKMANVATDTVFYRKTAGTGVPEVQTLATLKTDLGLSGTNTGDQTSIVGITGTLAEFNTALTGADFATGGGTATGTNTGDQTITLTGDVTGSGTGSFTATLATVNASPQTDTFRKVTVNGKGLVTATSAVSNSDINTAHGSQTANFVLAAPNGSAGTPSFRALVAADIPTLNQNTTGSAATLTTGRTIGMTGDVTWTSASFNGSANVTGTATIGNGVVTLAKQADVATASIMGRVTAGTGSQEALTGTQATTLLDTFTSALKGLAPASGGGTTNFLRADGTWAAPPGGGGGSPGGSTTQIQFNDAGAFAGDADLTWDKTNNVLGLNGSATLTGLAAAPSAPSSGNLSIYAKSIANRLLPQIKEPGGLTSVLQPALFDKQIILYLPSSGSTGTGSGSGLGPAWTSNGTVIHPTPSTTSPAISNQLRRTRYANVATTTNQTLGIRSGTSDMQCFWRGNAAGLGGFFFQTRFIVELYPASTIRIFAGLAATVANYLVSSDTVSISCCGLWHDTTDPSSGSGAFNFLTYDGTTATKQAINLANAIAAGNSYDFSMWCDRNGSTIYWELRDLVNSVTYSNSTSTTLPSNTTLLGPQVAMSNGTANVTVTTSAIGIAGVYVESAR